MTSASKASATKGSNLSSRCQSASIVQTPRSWRLRFWRRLYTDSIAVATRKPLKAHVDLPTRSSRTGPCFNRASREKGNRRGLWAMLATWRQSVTVLTFRISLNHHCPKAPNGMVTLVATPSSWVNLLWYPAWTSGSSMACFDQTAVLKQKYAE